MSRRCVRVRAIVVGVLLSGLIVMAAGCFLYMESYEPWEPVRSLFLFELGAGVDEFPDDAHALAYALSVNCFQNIEPRSHLDRQIQEACRTEEGILSEVMSLENLCGLVAAVPAETLYLEDGADICGGDRR